MNDLRHNVEKMIYIIPTNFLFGFSVSNKIRKDFFPYYNIKKAIIFERKTQPSHKPIRFKALKINNVAKEKEYILSPENFYRAGGEFDEFVFYFKSTTPLKIKFYLTLD
ncbi:MAG: SAM-dependent DNA methyltransferase, partial [Caldimicrobium sp.]